MSWKYVQYNGETGKRRTVEGGGGGGASSFSELEDVDFTNLQNGQVPKYNSNTQKWENADESGGTVTDVQVNGESVVNQQGEAEITSYKEVTQAEYNALPSSKETDGVLYCIKDVGGADSFPPLIYSYEEREIGVWADGKPIYQLTVYIPKLAGSTDYDRTYKTAYIQYSSSSATVTNNVTAYVRDVKFPINNSEIDTVISVVGGAGSGRKRAFVHATRVADTVYDIHYTLGDPVDNKFTVYVWNIENRSTWDAYLTVQYTKTSDTAGSGMWTTQGSYAHHYSTTEHVIGTWIDGKPLYEKVVTLNKTIQGNTWVQLPELNSLNIDKCIDWKFYSDANTIVGGQYDWNATPNEIWLYRNTSLSMKAIYICYTKTTD